VRLGEIVFARRRVSTAVGMSFPPTRSYTLPGHTAVNHRRVNTLKSL
jgi:hypothetical protein